MSTPIRNDFEAFRPTLLVINDEPSILYAFRKFFGEPDATLLTASTAAEGIELVKRHRPDVIILDVHLPDDNGLNTFHHIHKFDARIPVVFITGHGTTDMAIEAIKHGAFDYLFKPLEFDALCEVVDRAMKISRLTRVPTVVADEQVAEGPSDALIGRCPAMREVYSAIGRVAPQDVTVLIAGESGTGKELVARAIYHHSRRASGPFLAINCAAIPESLLESELFGHEKGAFTGADRLRVGKFEQCHGGTLFLDEIGDMTPLTQTKILRVLQDQQFERVGGNETIHTDVRVIAATNRDLQAAVADGSFRRDLYYRLSVFSINLPPLRERREDLPLLVEHYLGRYSRELGKSVHEIAPETLDILRRHPWSGNVRELQSVLKQALLRATGSVLIPDFLPASLHVDDGSAPRTDTEINFGDWDRFIREQIEAGSQDVYAAATALTERRVLTRVLEHTKGNQVQAARILGISRPTLRAKLRSLGLDPDRFAWQETFQPSG
ncbi:MAG: sigma-54-dependent Fis family transcriptional regulator [Planctomycetales bacterium]|nr:sigma-54-dependent Fis family transcriptional regulator [Planctomycetales bacterium]